MVVWQKNRNKKEKKCQTVVRFQYRFRVRVKVLLSPHATCRDLSFQPHKFAMLFVNETMFFGKQ